ncbi:MAG: M20 family metallo-hydrolase [Spirochaetales bacterium]|uniref:M20 family metallo-hydrolase n=1 Tax=Candidatus Thalassospirochaeta sargassi TaxID=3119039 RepID=A0AAJ1ID42_9SPIO|nr:M20 family metallo-hydrolase [Spirochaetales bacterium]
MELKDLRIDGARLQSTIEESAKIGKTDNNGLIRCAATDEDKIGRDLLVKWYKECGCEVTIDEMGNIFAKRPGKNPSLGAVMTGSHFDTQRPGGRFDGILGVLGALEVMRVINDHNIELERDLIIVDWTNEEGGWFAPACMGSGVWVGNHTKEWAYARKDRDGETVFGEELERIGYKGTYPASHKEWDIYAAYELHIEQGPQLWNEKIQIGAPKGILCLHWYDIWLEGTANQVGPTPMIGRNDALLAFSEMNMVVNKVAHQMGNMVGTVGEIQNYPNSRNIIPDAVHFTVDIRSWDDEHAIKAWEMMKKEFEVIAERRGCPIRTEETWKVAHAPFDQDLWDRVAETSEELGYSCKRMVSGAGHDMSEVNQVTRGAMIFVPSINGRSHVEVEDTPYEDCERGTNVLLHCILKTANEV